MSYIHNDFQLYTKTSRRLYHDHAAQQPILDYHTHLSPQDIADNRQFSNLCEIWLDGDHYKWRAMRANGIEERYCTGNAEPYEKFLAWAKTMPYLVRNPLYLWSHLELKRYFGIEELLNEKTAFSIWERANAQLQTENFTTQGILEQFHVTALCTTDDPIDDLAAHRQIASANASTRVFPTFRPDRALGITDPQTFNPWVDQLEKASRLSIGSLSDFLEALDQRHSAFHDAGCRLSDHGLPHCYADFPSENEAGAIFDRARSGQTIDDEAHAKFASYLMLFFGRLDAQRNWTKQLHIGPIRNVSTRRHAQIGPNAGFDSIGDSSQVLALGAYLDRLDIDNALPRMIIYNNNPSDNYAFATMLGNFQDGSIPGKMQFGAAWWYLDTKDGMEAQLNTLSNVGLLSRFVGMLTDSRSFMSYPRHEYFRRVLCNLIGSEIERGEIPNDDELIIPLIENLCYRNAQEYLGLNIG